MSLMSNRILPSNGFDESSYSLAESFERSCVLATNVLQGYDTPFEVDFEEMCVDSTVELLFPDGRIVLFNTSLLTSTDSYGAPEELSSGPFFFEYLCWESEVESYVARLYKFAPDLSLPRGASLSHFLCPLEYILQAEGLFAERYK